jgi:hypothetical protein
VRAGILARGALYFCKTVGGQAVCDEQSDWHLLRERSGRLFFRTRKHFMLPFTDPSLSPQRSRSKENDHHSENAGVNLAHVSAVTPQERTIEENGTWWM